MIKLRPLHLIAIGIIAIAAAALHFSVKAPRQPIGGQPGYTSIATVPIQQLQDEQFARSADEAPLAYVARINKLVHDTTFHCEPTDMNLSWLEQTVATVLLRRDVLRQGVIIRSRFDCGFCHQRAYLVHQAISKAGIDSEVFGLIGHVVVRLVVDGQTYFVDPDLGPGPFPAPDGDAASVDVAAVYADSSESMIDTLEKIYGDSSTDRPYGGLDMAAFYQGLIFTVSDIVALLLFTLGAAGIVLGSAMGIRATYDRRMKAS